MDKVFFFWIKKYRKEEVGRMIIEFGWNVENRRKVNNWYIIEYFLRYMEWEVMIEIEKLLNSC